MHSALRCVDSVERRANNPTRSQAQREPHGEERPNEHACSLVEILSRPLSAASAVHRVSPPHTNRAQSERRLPGLVSRLLECRQAKVGQRASWSWEPPSEEGPRQAPCVPSLLRARSCCAGTELLRLWAGRRDSAAMKEGNQRPRARASGAGAGVSSKTAAHRARVPHSAIEKPRVSKDYRIRRLIDLRLSLEYQIGVTPATLAAEWGVSVSLVEHDAAEAARLIDLYQDPEEVRRHCLTRVRQAIDEGGRDRVRAMELALKATGNLVERVELSHPTRTTPDMYAAALEHPGFVAWLKEQGWRPPVPAMLTEGEVDG